MTETHNVDRKRFERDGDLRIFPQGRFEVVQIGGLTLGRASYEPGWKWSRDVGPTVGASRCTVEHVGLVVSGAVAVAFDDDRVVTLEAGELFYIPAIPHDSWVVGDQPYVSLHVLGAEQYAAGNHNQISTE
jgi:cupin domain